MLQSIPGTLNLPQLNPAPGMSARTLQDSDFEAWLGLRDEVIATLPEPDLYVREADEALFFAQHTGQSGACVGLFDGQRLVAYAMLGFPMPGASGHLGAAMGWGLQAQQEVAHLASCMVVPAWRGHRLQQTLLAARLALAQAAGRHICLAMLALGNHASRHNLLRQGLHLAWTGEMGGLHRHIAMIDVRSGLHLDMGDELLLASDDFDGLCAAARQGYAGVGELRQGEQVRLRYLRVLRHAPPPP